jgi:hypothetical protein
MNASLWDTPAEMSVIVTIIIIITVADEGADTREWFQRFIDCTFDRI